MHYGLVAYLNSVQKQVYRFTRTISYCAISLDFKVIGLAGPFHFAPLGLIPQSYAVARALINGKTNAAGLHYDANFFSNWRV